MRGEAKRSEFVEVMLKLPVLGVTHVYSHSRKATSSIAAGLLTHFLKPQKAATFFCALPPDAP